jgi:hypothetical protein
MKELEDRLRQDLPDLADALIAQSPGGSAPFDTAQDATFVMVLPSPSDQPHASRRKRTPLLVAASLVIGLIGAGIAANAILGDAPADEANPAIAAQLEDDGHDPDVADASEAAIQEDERRAALRSDPPGSLTEATARWADEGFSTYRYHLDVLTLDRTITVHIEVAGSSARRVDPLPLPPGIEPPVVDPEWIATIEELFELATQAAPPLIPTFDPELGYPTVFRLDPDETKTGDELTFRVKELSSMANIEAAERTLADWLPEPRSVPPELDGLSRDTSAVELYPLHETDGLLVNLARQGHYICLVKITGDPSTQTHTGMSQSNCTSVTRLRDEGLATRLIGSGSPNDLLAFFAVLPATHHGQIWEPEVTTGQVHELLRSDQSVLILFDDDEQPGPVRIEIRCECGDLGYDVQIG